VTHPSAESVAAAGRTNREIAERLVLSVKTVEWNLSKVYEKVGVRSRTQLAAQYPGEAAGIAQEIDSVRLT